jgi:hypothetical protein
VTLFIHPRASLHFTLGYRIYALQALNYLDNLNIFSCLSSYNYVKITLLKLQPKYILSLKAIPNNKLEGVPLDETPSS